MINKKPQKRRFIIKSFPSNKTVRMDICVKKKKQFFKALYKAIEGRILVKSKQAIF